MSGFLTRLAERSLADGPTGATVRPRPVSLFEPAVGDTAVDGEGMAAAGASNGRPPSESTDGAALRSMSAVSEATPALAEARASPEDPQPRGKRPPAVPSIELPERGERAAAPQSSTTGTEKLPREATTGTAPVDHGAAVRPPEPSSPTNDAAPVTSPITDPGGRAHGRRQLGVREQQLPPAASRALADGRVEQSGQVVSRQRLSLPELVPASGRSAVPLFASPAPTRAPLEVGERAEPVVHVSIGRVEIRAQERPAGKPSPQRTPRPPALGLAEYLQRRSQGRAR